jgi:hypothetical protein
VKLLAAVAVWLEQIGNALIELHARPLQTAGGAREAQRQTTQGQRREAQASEAQKAMLPHVVQHAIGWQMLAALSGGMGAAPLEVAPRKTQRHEAERLLQVSEVVTTLVTLLKLWLYAQ